MQNLSPRDLIYQKALSFLSRREYSTQELKIKLQQRFAEYAEFIPEVLADLQAKNYLSDRKYAQMMIRHRASQAYGPNYIKQELKSQRVEIDEDYFYDDEVMATFFEGWLRKFKSRFKVVPSGSLEQAQLMKYFLQRGFTRDQIKEYLDRVRGFDLDGRRR